MSALAGVGKTRLIKQCEKVPSITLEIFYSAEAHPAELISAGFEIICPLYSVRTNYDTFEALRFG